MKLFNPVVCVALLLFSSLSVAERPVFSLPDQAYEVAKGVVYLGGLWKNGRLVEGYAFIHKPKRYSAKPEGKGKGKPGGGGSNTSSCYAFTAKGARWRTAEPYSVDPTNADNLSATYVLEQMEAAVMEWDKQVDEDIFGLRVSEVIDGADTISPDGKNEIYFGSIDDPNTIAVTIVWGIFGGPPHGRELLEWDQIYNDDDFLWGNVDLHGSGVMDFANIAVHEVGHAAGMNHPEDSCTEETMYRYSGEGETKKRTLNAGDIGGVNALY
ncbi:matrixin family metalloprotease [bacterium AH-315-K03]|nr:matrixin family metalloprotease [bacterium AH-315-K03]